MKSKFREKNQLKKIQLFICLTIFCIQYMGFGYYIFIIHNDDALNFIDHIVIVPIKDIAVDGTQESYHGSTQGD